MGFPFKSSLLAAGLLAAVSAGAQTATEQRPAEMPPCPPEGCVKGEGARRPHLPPHARGGKDGEHRRETPEQHRARFDAEMARRAQALKITSAQQSKWDAYVQARKSIFDDIAKNRESKQDFEKLSPDQRMELHAKRMEEGARHMRKVARSMKSLRAALTAEQREQFDQMEARGRKGGHPAPHGERGGRRGPVVPKGAPQAPQGSASAQR